MLTIKVLANVGFREMAWMAKLLYAIKIYLFGNQYDILRLTKRKKLSFIDLCSLVPLFIKDPTCC